MKHIISLELEELDATFIEKLKTLHDSSHAHLTIIVEEAQDETEYLLQSQANRHRLMKSLESAEQNKLIHSNLDEFRAMTHA